MIVCIFAGFVSSGWAWSCMETGVWVISCVNQAVWILVQ